MLSIGGFLKLVEALKQATYGIAVLIWLSNQTV